MKSVIGVCEICGRPATERDHDHITGRIRGALCGYCNSGIGYMGDNPDLLHRAELYLRRPAVGPLYADNVKERMREATRRHRKRNPNAARDTMRRRRARKAAQ